MKHGDPLLAGQEHDELPAGPRATTAATSEIRYESKDKSPDPVHGKPRYGGFNNLECAGELSAVYDRWAARAAQTGTRPVQSHAHEHAIHMALMKISRIATGDFDVDHYDDAKVYAELAKQVRAAQNQKP